MECANSRLTDIITLQFKLYVENEPLVTQSYMRNDIYLIKWLRGECFPVYSTIGKVMSYIMLKEICF